MNIAAIPPFKAQLAQLMTYLEREVERSGVTVHLNTEITADSECLKCADQIVVALGASPIVPKIAGIDRKNVIEVSQAHTTRRNDIKGERIVVLGGGFAGCEFALEMAQSGKKATVVEMTGTLAAKGNPENRAALQLLLNQYGVKQYVNSRAIAFDRQGVVIEHTDGRRETLPADIAIVALGTRNRKGAAEAIQAKYPNTWLVGDCKGQVALIGDAIYDAYRTVWLFEGDIQKKKAWLKKRERDAKLRMMLASHIMPTK